MGTSHAQAGLVGMVRALLGAGADPNLRERAHGHTPLHACGTHGSAAVARLLTDAGADPSLEVLPLPSTHTHSVHTHTPPTHTYTLAPMLTSHGLN